MKTHIDFVVPSKRESDQRVRNRNRNRIRNRIGIGNGRRGKEREKETLHQIETEKRERAA